MPRNVGAWRDRVNGLGDAEFPDHGVRQAEHHAGCRTLNDGNGRPGPAPVSSRCGPYGRGRVRTWLRRRPYGAVPYGPGAGRRTTREIATPKAVTTTARDGTAARPARPAARAAGPRGAPAFPGWRPGVPPQTTRTAGRRNERPAAAPRSRARAPGGSAPPRPRPRRATGPRRRPSPAAGDRVGESIHDPDPCSTALSGAPAKPPRAAACRRSRTGPGSPTRCPTTGRPGPSRCP